MRERIASTGLDLGNSYLMLSSAGDTLIRPRQTRNPIVSERLPKPHKWAALLDRPSDASIEQFNASMASFWQPVLRSDDLVANELKSVTLLGQPLVLARLDNQLTALLDVCRHFQAQLSLGEITSINGKQAVQCPYHGWAYGANGQCVRIPQLDGSRKIPASIAVPRFSVAESLGLIWVCLSGDPQFELPIFPEYDNPDFRVTTLDEQEPTKTSAPRMIMATLDDTHFPWVHEGILGNRDQVEAPDHTVTRETSELVVRYRIDQPPSRATGGELLGAHNSEQLVSVGIEYENTVHMPNFITLRKTTPAGKYIICLATCPIDYRHTKNFWTFAREYDKDPANDKLYEEFSAHVRSQDKPIVESQRPWLLPPFWTKIELPQAGIDEPLIEYQRWLQELGVVIDL